MENIIKPDETFDFTKLSLSHPVGIQGGAFFTKIEYNNKSLYIQTCKSLTKQGFVKAGKKYYCDLMLDKNSETLINWFENLEENCKKLIYGKKDTWFENSLEENDIETAFNSVMKIYKSGKYYLVRTNVKNNSSNLPSINIYDEYERVLTMTDITPETNIITILEIQGIKFSTRNFQIEIELKQIMALNNEPIFNNCLIKTGKTIVSEKDNSQYANQKPDILESTLENVIEKQTSVDTNNNSSENTDNVIKDEICYEDNVLEPVDIFLKNNKIEDTNKEDINKEDINKEDTDDISLDIKMEDLDEFVENNTDTLEEIKVDLNIDSLDTIQLKKPNQVYFELYKEARNKAKLAKKNAILAYLEAKNIKKTYLIENINDSDSDFDAEIEDVSESELEGL
jgi:hypothetical protein